MPDLLDRFHDRARRIGWRGEDLQNANATALDPHAIGEGAAGIDSDSQQGFGTVRHERASVPKQARGLRHQARGYNREVELRLREATKEDFPELWRIDQECFQPGIAYSRRELEWYMNLRGAFTIVGEARETPRSKWKIAGFAVGQQPRKGLGHVVTIDVLAHARREKLGTQLMKEIEKRLSESGCEQIFLETAVDNLPAIKFYKRLGYFVVKTIRRYYLDKIDALLMAKELGARAEGRDHSRNS